MSLSRLSLSPLPSFSSLPLYELKLILQTPPLYISLVIIGETELRTAVSAKINICITVEKFREDLVEVSGTLINSFVRRLRTYPVYFGKEWHVPCVCVHVYVTSRLYGPERKWKGHPQDPRALPARISSSSSRVGSFQGRTWTICRRRWTRPIRADGCHKEGCHRESKERRLFLPVAGNNAPL